MNYSPVQNDAKLENEDWVEFQKKPIARLQNVSTWTRKTPSRAQSLGLLVNFDWKLVWKGNSCLTKKWCARGPVSQLRNIPVRTHRKKNWKGKRERPNKLSIKPLNINLHVFFKNNFVWFQFLTSYTLFTNGPSIELNNSIQFSTKSFKSIL